jgi:hypothetical protein
VVVTVTVGVGAVVTDPVTPKHEQAEMNSSALAQLAANSGIELGTTVTCLPSSSRLAGVAVGVKVSSSTVTVTVLMDKKFALANPHGLATKKTWEVAYVAAGVTVVSRKLEQEADRSVRGSRPSRVPVTARLLRTMSAKSVLSRTTSRGL